VAGVREAELGVSGQLVVSLPVEAEQLRIDVALEGGHEVLRGDAMSGLVEEDRDEAVRAGAEEGVHHHDLRHRVVRAARVAAVAARRAHRGEEDDGVAAQLDVVGEVGLLGLGQRGVGERVDLDLAVRREVEREREGVGRVLQAQQGAGSESRMRCGAHAAVFFRYGARPVPATIWHKGRQKGGPDGENGEAPRMAEPRGTLATQDATEPPRQSGAHDRSVPSSFGGCPRCDSSWRPPHQLRPRASSASWSVLGMR